MRYSELLDRLQKLTNHKPSQAELCNVLNIKQSAMSNRFNRDSDFSSDEIVMISNYYGINLFNNVETKDSVTIDYYPDVLVSCGNGIFSLGETKEKMTVPKHFIKGYSDAQKYIIVTAFSNSMQPKIEEKDLLIVRLTNFEEIMDNHIYVFCHEGRFYCKYLSYNVGQLVVKSENPDYPTRYIEKDNLCNFELIGEIVGLMRDFR